jgi:uncharacterized protein (TIGR03437 family)
MATVTYVGLTPLFLRLYRANFQVPNVVTGDHPLVITIDGRRSKAPAPVITVGD